MTCRVSVGWNVRPAFSGVPIVSKYELLTTRVTVRGPAPIASASAPSMRNSRCCGNDPASGAADATAAFFTAARALTRSSTSRLNCSAGAVRRVLRSDAKSGACRLSTFARSKPGSTAYSRIRLRVSSPAPMSSMNDAASWLTTSARCARRRPRPPVDAAAAGRHRAHGIVHERQARRPREQQRHRRRDERA